VIPCLIDILDKKTHSNPIHSGSSATSDYVTRKAEWEKKYREYRELHKKLHSNAKFFEVITQSWIVLMFIQLNHICAGIARQVQRSIEDRKARDCKSNQEILYRTYIGMPPRIWMPAYLASCVDSSHFRQCDCGRNAYLSCITKLKRKRLRSLPSVRPLNCPCPILESP